MAQLYISNVNFESTGNNQLTYSANTISFRVGGATALTINSTTIANSAGVNTSLSAGFVNGFSNYNIVGLANGGFLTANQSLTVTGALIHESNITPVTISANTSDWNPGLGNTYLVRLSANNSAPNTEFYITGMAAGTNGQLVVLNNIGTKDIWIRNEEAGSNSVLIPGQSVPSSTATNRFNLPDHIKLSGYQSATFYYDGSLSRWRLTNSNDVGYDYKRHLTKAWLSGGFVSPTTGMTPAGMIATYATETTADAPAAVQSQKRYRIGAHGNACKGFVHGGGGPGLTAVESNIGTSRTDRVTYVNDTSAVVPGAFMDGIGMTATGNADRAFNQIYTNYGTAPATVTQTIIHKFENSIETSFTVPSAATPLGGRQCAAGVGNSCKAFFATGRLYPTVPAYYTGTCRLTYATDTSASLSSLMAIGRVYTRGHGNSDKGFVSGGFVAPIPAQTATSERITYATETWSSSPSSALAISRYDSAWAGTSDNGYLWGGTAGCTRYSNACRNAYSTETNAAVPGFNMTGARSGAAGV